jgi:hypothetical protein
MQEMISIPIKKRIVGVMENHGGGTGGTGTLSEIALALHAGKPVIGLNVPEMVLARSAEIVRVSTVDEPLRIMDRIIAGGKTTNQESY